MSNEMPSLNIKTDGFAAKLSNARLRADGMPSLNVDMNTLALRLSEQRHTAPKQADKTMAL